MLSRRRFTTQKAARSSSRNDSMISRVSQPSFIANQQCQQEVSRYYSGNLSMVGALHLLPVNPVFLGIAEIAAGGGLQTAQLLVAEGRGLIGLTSLALLKQLLAELFEVLLQVLLGVELVVALAVASSAAVGDIQPIYVADQPVVYAILGQFALETFLGELGGAFCEGWVGLGVTFLLQQEQLGADMLMRRIHLFVLRFQLFHSALEGSHRLQQFLVGVLKPEIAAGKVGGVSHVRSHLDGVKSGLDLAVLVFKVTDFRFEQPLQKLLNQQQLLPADHVAVVEVAGSHGLDIVGPALPLLLSLVGFLPFVDYSLVVRHILLPLGVGLHVVPLHFVDGYGGQCLQFIQSHILGGDFGQLSCELPHLGLQIVDLHLVHHLVLSHPVHHVLQRFAGQCSRLLLEFEHLPPPVHLLHIALLLFRCSALPLQLALDHLYLFLHATQLSLLSTAMLYQLVMAFLQLVQVVLGSPIVVFALSYTAAYLLQYELPVENVIRFPDQLASSHPPDHVVDRQQVLRWGVLLACELGLGELHQRLFLGFAGASFFFFTAHPIEEELQWGRFYMLR